MKKTVSIIIVHWNTPDLLYRRLVSLTKDFKIHLIVVDNASKKSINWLKEDFPSVIFIQNKLNRGYAFACNQGMLNAVGEPARHASQGEAGGWLLFLNPDVEITPSQINEMVNYAKKNDLDALSVKTTESYGKPLPSSFSLLAEFTPLNRLERFLSRVLGIGMTGGGEKTLFGGCLLLKAEVLKSLGGWDERFFLWFEDSDLTLRLLKNNYKIGWAPINIKHIGGISFTKLEERTQRDVFFHSMNVYAKKHFSFFGKIIVAIIKRKYTQRKLLPPLFEGTSITVPNMTKKNLAKFFENNNQAVTAAYYTFQVEWIVVTSSIRNSNIWEWRSRYPEVRFIPIEKNKGFASTVNIGFRASTGKWVGTINDDIVITKDWLKNLLTCDDKLTGSINPIIKNVSGKIESVGVKILPRGKAEPITDYPFDNGRAKWVTNHCLETDATNAAAVIYSKEALNKVGLFDEKFGSYLEDIDLSLRLKRAGFKNVVSVTSKVIHKGQATSTDLGTKKQFYDFRNWIYVILKNWSLEDLVINLPAILLERLKNISGILKKMV